VQRDNATEPHVDLVDLGAVRGAEVSDQQPAGGVVLRPLPAEPAVLARDAAVLQHEVADLASRGFQPGGSKIRMRR
jgi:hypothetical protein